MFDNKVEEFKSFVKANPFLISYIRDKKKTWQELYELYDIVGDNQESWNKYLESSDNNKTTSSSFKLEDLVRMAKNIDVNKMQEGLTSLQKTLTLFGEILPGSKVASNTYNPRPLYRRFED